MFRDDKKYLLTPPPPPPKKKPIIKSDKLELNNRRDVHYTMLHTVHN